MQLNLKLCVKDSVKSIPNIPNSKPDPNLKAKPTCTTPDPHLNDHQLSPECL